jgi:hypothetical protein
MSSANLDDLMTEAAFLGMFNEIEGCTDRDAQYLKSFDPTDVQAEVMVFEVIEPKFIIGAAFQTKAALDKYADLMGNRRKCVVQKAKKGFYANRTYHRQTYR